eukprot:5746822-Prymnesium_polylepis.2
MWPNAHAAWSAVWPSVSARSTSARSDSSVCTHAVLPSMLADTKGVSPPTRTPRDAEGVPRSSAIL